MTKVLILMRHAETTKNKSNLNRGISVKGKKLHTRKSEELLSKVTDMSNARMFCSESKRAVQSAMITKKIVRTTKSITIDKFRLNNIENIEDIIQSNSLRGWTPAQTYLQLIASAKKGLEVESPDVLIARWDKLTKETGPNVILIISHECSLEAYLYFQKGYKLQVKSFDKYFGYSDYAILEAKV